MDATFKTYQQLMPHRVREILFISSPYDAYIMEEDGGLMEHVFTSYSGIGLLNPPRFTVVSSATEAIEILTQKIFDLVVTMPRNVGMDVISLGQRIKRLAPDLPVVLLVQSSRSVYQYSEEMFQNSIDKVFIWSGNRNIMLAIVKWVEDKMNVAHDIEVASVRVIILIEDSPYYYSSILPLLYRSVVRQTQAVLGDSLNDEHLLMKLRARTKILMASTYEEGMDLYNKFRPYIIGILSDIRFPREGKLDSEAGFSFREKVMSDTSDIPVLLLSAEKSNKEKAELKNALFQDKNSPSFHSAIKKFLVDHLGFGDFVFRTKDGVEVARASNLSSLEKILETVSEESLRYHSSWNHFSNWMMARSEVQLAADFRKKHTKDLSIEEVRRYLINSIHERRMVQRRGIVTAFHQGEFEEDSDFIKIGEGSLGGKARGLAFMSKYLLQNINSFKKFKKINVQIPRSLVLTTECFDNYIDQNELNEFSEIEATDKEVAERFLKAKLPEDLEKSLRLYLMKLTEPLAVRSSSLLEDSKFRPYAGLYKTYMLTNNHPDFEVRFRQLSEAIKMIYASVFFEGPKAFSRATLHRTEEEKMGVLIQRLTGKRYGDYFYPAISGTAQSHNYYPVSYMRSSEGISHIALGLGRTVVEGEQALRFSPKYPQFLPQFASVETTLKNSQQHFFALKMTANDCVIASDDLVNLVRREIYEAVTEPPVKMLSGSYIMSDHRIRDTFNSQGLPVVNFSKILKYNTIQLPELLSELLSVCKKGIGSDLEIEFAINIDSNPDVPAEFVLLQARPMTTQEDLIEVNVEESDIEGAICYSGSALGRGPQQDIHDIIYIKPEMFSSKNTIKMASEIGRYNAILEKEDRSYLLVGPGRWGSADHCLGVPVVWQDISKVKAIAEVSTKSFQADPSQGTHFFQNITSLGISYFTVYEKEDFFDWNWLKNQKIVRETDLICHVSFVKPLRILISGKNNKGVIRT